MLVLAEGCAFKGPEVNKPPELGTLRNRRLRGDAVVKETTTFSYVEVLLLDILICY